MVSILYYTITVLSFKNVSPKRPPEHRYKRPVINVIRGHYTICGLICIPCIQVRIHYVPILYSLLVEVKKKKRKENKLKKNTKCNNMLARAWRAVNQPKQSAKDLLLYMQRARFITDKCMVRVEVYGVYNTVRCGDEKECVIVYAHCF